MFPIRSEHASDTLPSGIYETKQEAGAFPVNLTNPRLRWKRDLLKGTPLTSALFLLDCWALVGYPGTVQSAGSSWNCASLTFQWRPPTLRLSRELWPTEPYCLAAGGGGDWRRGCSLADPPGPSPKSGQRLDFIKPEGISGSGLQVKVLYKKYTVLIPEAAPTAAWRPRPTASPGPLPAPEAAAPASARSGFRGNPSEPVLASQTLLP